MRRMTPRRRGPMTGRITPSRGRPNIDTGGEFHLPPSHGVMRKSGADGEVPDHRTGLPLDTNAPCHSAHSRLIRSPMRPNASPRPPSPKAPCASIADELGPLYYIGKQDSQIG